MSCTIFIRTGYVESQSNGCLVVSRSVEASAEEHLQHFANTIYSYLIDRHSIDVDWIRVNMQGKSCCKAAALEDRFCRKCGREFPNKEDFRPSYDSFVSTVVELARGDADSTGGDLWSWISISGWNYHNPPGPTNWIILDVGEAVLARLVKDRLKDPEECSLKGEAEFLHWEETLPCTK